MLNNVEDYFNERVDHLSEDEQLIVDDVLPDLASLGLDCIDLVVSQNKHGRENAVFRVHVDVLRLCLNDVVLEFFDQRVHQDGRACTHT